MHIRKNYVRGFDFFPAGAKKGKPRGESGRMGTDAAHALTAGLSS